MIKHSFFIIKSRLHICCHFSEFHSFTHLGIFWKIDIIVLQLWNIYDPPYFGIRAHPILIVFQFFPNFLLLAFWQKGDFGSIMHIISHILPHHISFGNPRNVFFLWWAHSILVLVRLSAIDFSFAAIDFFFVAFSRNTEHRKLLLHQNSLLCPI